MAKIQLTDPYKAFSGKSAANGGGVLYADKKGRPIRRDYVIPQNPETTAQSAIRNYFTLASALWQTLDAAEVASWVTFANSVPAKDVYGQDYSKTPRGCFIGVNVMRQIDGQSMIETAPTYGVIGGITSVTNVEYNTEDLDIDIAVTFANGLRNSYVLIRGVLVPNYPARKARPNDLRMLSTDIPGNIMQLPASGNVHTFTIADLNISPAAGATICLAFTTLGSIYWNCGYYAQYQEVTHAV